MRTIWDVVLDLKAHGKKLELLKEERWDILYEASAIIKSMTDDEVVMTLTKAIPGASVYEDSGLHDDFYAVSAGFSGGKPLGYGSTKIEAQRSALKEVVCQQGEYNKYLDEKDNDNDEVDD